VNILISWMKNYRRNRICLKLQAKRHSLLELRMLDLLRPILSQKIRMCSFQEPKAIQKH